VGINAAHVQNLDKRPEKIHGRSSSHPGEPRACARVRRARPLEDTLEAPPLPNSEPAGALQKHFVLRSPKQLRLHPAIARLNLASSLLELEQPKPANGVSGTVPILITANGTIISGFRDWQAALHDQCAAIECIEYCLSDDEALQFVLTNQRPRRFWNSFSRIRLALELDPYFQAKASANQSLGGKYKGSANLPEAARIEIRQEIARLAGVGPRNVSHVKTILEKAHPRLIDALQDGTVSIHRAVQLCNLSRFQQLEQLLSYAVERATSKVARQAVSQLRMERPGEHPIAMLKALQEHAMRDPGSVVVRPGSSQQTVILLGRDFQSQVEPTLK
jgi:hypothetical protein